MLLLLFLAEKLTLKLYDKFYHIMNLKTTSGCKSKKTLKVLSLKTPESFILN